MVQLRMAQRVGDAVKFVEQGRILSDKILFMLCKIWLTILHVYGVYSI